MNSPKGVAYSGNGFRSMTPLPRSREKERARERIMDKLREVSIEAKAADISLLDLLGMFEKAYREQS